MTYKSKWQNKTRRITKKRNYQCNINHKKQTCL